MYYIAYGMETQSIEEPDQLVLLPMPDHTAEMDSTELVSYIESHPSLKALAEDVVGVRFVRESLALALQSIGVSKDKQQEAIDTVTDAIINNVYG